MTQSSVEPSVRLFLSRWRLHLGFVLGPSLFVLMILLPAPEAIPRDAWLVLAMTLLMAVWWVTESLPIAITALLPVALLPILDIAPIEAAAAPYANPLIFLFLGGFILAECVQRWNLHRRLALLVLSIAGTRPDQVVGGFMMATAGLSMWVSNTATAALMLPIGLSVLRLLDQDNGKPDNHNLTVCLLLGIAFGANIGGMATLIGTPPNALMAGYLQDNHGLTVTFGTWMAFAFPLSAILLAVAWWLLTRWVFPISHTPIPGLRDLFVRETEQLGPMRGPEKAVLGVFVLVALAWLARPLIDQALPQLQLTDAGIAITGALLLFVIPANWRRLEFLMTWDSARNIPWGVLLLVGGGLSLGTAIEQTGLAELAAGGLRGLTVFPVWLLIGAVVVTVMALSHVTSNTATAATLLPLTVSIAVSQGIAIPYLAIPVAMAASCALMLPVATPPNAIVFSSEKIRVTEMIRGGGAISGVAIVLISAWIYLVAAPWLTAAH